MRRDIVLALQSGIGDGEVARHIRLECYTSQNYPWDGVARTDKTYHRIHMVIYRVKAHLKNGKLDDIIHSDSSKILKSKTVSVGSRGRFVLDPKKELESKLIKWCRENWNDNKHITRGIVFRQAMQLDPTFMGGLRSHNHFKKLMAWFYLGFKKRHKLSRRKISSCGQKLPKDWKKKSHNIVRRIAHRQMPRQRADGSFQQGAADDFVGNSDHVPFWIESHSNHQWGEKEVHHRRLVKTAGKEKDRFTVQLTVFKSGRKAPPFIIFKAARAPPGKPCGRKGTVTHEIHHDLPDRWGNKYPPKDKCVITVSATANSSGELTCEIMDKVFFPAMGINDGECDHLNVMLVDDFRGHSDHKVKSKMKAISNIFKLDIMSGGSLQNHSHLMCL